MGIFQTAATTILRHEKAESSTDASREVRLASQSVVIGGNLSRDAWINSVVKGADERSLRWKHLLVIGGLILGYESQAQNGLTRSAKSTLHTAFTMALNAASIEVRDEDELGASTTTLVLNYIFPLLADADRARLAYDVS